MIKPTVQQLHEFLLCVDTMFPVPLSHKQNLSAFSEKLCEKATLCVKWQNDKIVGMVAGYTDNVENCLGYISVVAVLPGLQGKGLGRKLVSEFLTISRNKGLAGVHLYTVADNEPAVKLYHSLGFTDFKVTDEPRPDDVHLVCYFNKEGDRR
ncbi:MAG: GNAT family N-acetyltransferase [Clostridia bacterium]|nr:GNAT family N-acetyltransferase [Clostridia bacterium]